MDFPSCRLCHDHHSLFSSSVIIHIDSKPSLDFSLSRWLPSPVRTLFIAEAPPFLGSHLSQKNDSFFYNPLESQRFLGIPSPLSGSLSWNLFDLLDIDNQLPKVKKLEKFKQSGFYFIDAVKCRVERPSGSKLLNKTVKNCSQFLQQEILDLAPKTIVVLGERALYSLSIFPPFQSVLENYTLLELFEQTQNAPLVFDDFLLFATPLPLWHNRNHLSDFLEIFQQIKKL